MCIVFSKLYRSEQCCVLDKCIVFKISVLCFRYTYCVLDKCIVFRQVYCVLDKCIVF